MRDIRIAAAQFEHRDGDKAHNLGRIRDLTRRASGLGAEIVCFHECSVTAYTFLQTLSRDALDALAEPVPDGPSVRALIEIARESDVVVMAGLIEREPDGRLYKSYVTAAPEGYITKYHNLHPFISPHLTPGRGYRVIDLRGVTMPPYYPIVSTSIIWRHFNCDGANPTTTCQVCFKLEVDDADLNAVATWTGKTNNAVTNPFLCSTTCQFASQPLANAPFVFLAFGYLNQTLTFHYTACDCTGTMPGMCSGAPLSELYRDVTFN